MYDELFSEVEDLSLSSSTHALFSISEDKSCLLFVTACAAVEIVTQLNTEIIRQPLLIPKSSLFFH